VDKFSKVKVNETEWKSIITNDPKVKRIFFGRKSVDQESIFERLFKGPFSSLEVIYLQFPKLLNHVWATFQFKDQPEILILVGSRYKITPKFEI